MDASPSLPQFWSSIQQTVLLFDQLTKTIYWDSKDLNVGELRQRMENASPVEVA